MTTELEMLAWVSGLTIFMWVPYILAHISNVGLMPALTYESDNTPLTIPDTTTVTITPIEITKIGITLLLGSLNIPLTKNFIIVSFL